MVFFIEKNHAGGWTVWGDLGIRHYYGYTKDEAKQKYESEAKRTVFYNKKERLF